MPPPVYRHRPPRHAKVTAQAQAARRRQGRQGCRTGCRRRTRYGTGRQRHAKAKDAARQRTPPPPRMPPPYMIRHRHAKATAQARKAARHAARHARPHAAAARCPCVYTRIVYIRLHTCKPESLLNARQTWTKFPVSFLSAVVQFSGVVPAVSTRDIVADGVGRLILYVAWANTTDGQTIWAIMDGRNVW